MPSTYILTAELDGHTFAWLDELRRAHFPSDRNLLPAHLTMFHRLTSRQIALLGNIELPSAPVDIHLAGLLFLGSGVAVRVQSPDLEHLRAAACSTMAGQFSRQDSQPWRPHVTIQNKVAPATARQLHRALDSAFSPRTGAAIGLLVWEYLGGPWKLCERLQFLRPELRD